MLKLIIFTIFLISSPTFSLVQSLFQTENHCYSGCHANYIDNLSNLDACKQGCDYKLHDEKCSDQCKLLSIDKQIQASCLVGCSMNSLKKSIGNQDRQSIILIRQRPLIRLSSSSNDPVETFNDIIKQFKENKNLIRQIQLNIDNTNKVKHHREDKIDNLQQFIKNIRNKWNQFMNKQPKLPIWIILSIFILSSTILFYMIVSLCCNRPKHHNLSIRSQELIIEKEIIQPDSPIKIKLTNI